MNTSGWITMVLSVGGVAVFFGYSLFLVLSRERDKKKLHSTLDKTPDTNGKKE